MGTGIFLEPTDGAAFADVRWIGRSPRYVGGLGVGSYPVYKLCEKALEIRGRKRPILVTSVWPLKDEEAAVCVRTSKGQMAAVYSRFYFGIDDPNSDYRTFLWALFEHEPPVPNVERPSVKRK